MTPYEELFAISASLHDLSAAEALAASDDGLNRLEAIAKEVGRSFSGSWLGYHANVYYADLAPPPPGARFSQEWGLKDLSYTSLGSHGDWREFDPQELQNELRLRAGNPDLTGVIAAAKAAIAGFEKYKADIQSIILTKYPDGSDLFMSKLMDQLENINYKTTGEILEIWQPKGAIISRDMVAIGQRTQIPPHLYIRAEAQSIRQAFNICLEASSISRKAASHMERAARNTIKTSRIGTNVFIGHGRSLAWRELKDFVQDRLQLPWDEFNRVPVAGVTNQARLAEMLDAAAVAFIVMTAEDETAEGQMQARMNVIHEVGLFQGRLGFTRAIVLLEEGCQEFSNIQGIGQIRFPANRISYCFEEVRRFLERENIT